MAMDKFTRMIMNARKGDIDSIRELKDYIYEKAGVANKSLRALEKSGITEYAYGRAMTFLNTEYQSIKYPQSVSHAEKDDRPISVEQQTIKSTRKPIFPQAVAHRSVDSMITEALELHKFLASPTRTVRGAKLARKKQLAGIKMLQDLGYNIPQDPEKLSRISKILGTDGLNFTGTVRYEIMEAMADAMEEGSTDEEIMESVDRYASGDIVYNALLQELQEK